VNGTKAAAHGDVARVSIIQEAPAMGISEVQYFTCDEDRSLHELAEEIARKAGWRRRSA